MNLANSNQVVKDKATGTSYGVYYIHALTWGFLRCSFRQLGQCESLRIVERVTAWLHVFICIIRNNNNNLCLGVNRKKFIIMFCKYCGKEIDDNTKYCSFCGKQIEETNRLSTLKIPHINKWGLYFYGLWFVPNFALLLIGGTAEYSSKALFPSAFYKWEDDFTLWTFGNNHIHTSYKYWQFDIDFYDITDFLFYTILIPFVLFLLYKIFSSLHKLGIVAN